VTTVIDAPKTPLSHRLGRTETDGHSVSYRLGTARRERLPSGALIVLKFGSTVLGTRADPAVPAAPASRYGALHATKASGRVRLAMDGGAKIAR
jgi:hypothetical protein